MQDEKELSKKILCKVLHKMYDWPSLRTFVLTYNDLRDVIYDLGLNEEELLNEKDWIISYGR